MTFAWLVRLAALLDQRFPKKLVVTVEQYAALTDKVYRQGKTIETISDRLETIQNQQQVIDRIESVEARQAEIAKMLASPKKSEGEIMREQFIRGELHRPVVRKEVEVSK